MYAAMGLSKPVRDGMLRVSFGPENTRDQVDQLAAALRGAVENLLPAGAVRGRRRGAGGPVPLYVPYRQYLLDRPRGAAPRGARLPGGGPAFFIRKQGERIAGLCPAPRIV